MKATTSAMRRLFVYRSSNTTSKGEIRERVFFARSGEGGESEALLRPPIAHSTDLDNNVSQ
jgi:hypothetical protein